MGRYPCSKACTKSSRIKAALGTAGVRGWSGRAPGWGLEMIRQDQQNSLGEPRYQQEAIPGGHG